MTAADLGPVVEVHLLRMPVAVWARAKEHSDELFREFALIAAHPDAQASVPARLTELVEALNQTYAGVSTEQEAQLWAALDAGVAELDLVYRVPAAAAAASTALGAMMDEADEFCRTGEHLLTLTTPPELLRFRRWYLEQFVQQIGGAEPVPWPEYAAA